MSIFILKTQTRERPWTWKEGLRQTMDSSALQKQCKNDMTRKHTYPFNNQPLAVDC